MCFREFVRPVAAPNWRGAEGGGAGGEVEVQGGRPVGVGEQIRFNGIPPNEFVNLVDHNYQHQLPRHDDEEEERGFSANEYVHLISNNNEMNTVSTGGGGGGGGGSMGSKKNCDDEVMTEFSFSSLI